MYIYIYIYICIYIYYVMYRHNYKGIKLYTLRHILM